MCYRATYASEEIGIRPLDDAAFDFGLWLKALTLKMRPPCSSFLLLIKASVLHRALTPRAQAGTICSSEPAQSQSCKRAQSSLYDMAGTRQCRWYIGSTSAGCCDFQNKICIPIYKYNIYIYIYTATVLQLHQLACGRERLRVVLTAKCHYRQVRCHVQLRRCRCDIE